MTGFFLAFLAVVLTGIGARDQATVAMLSARLGQRPTLLAVALLAGALTAAVAAWLALAVIPMMNGPSRLFLAGLALGLGGIELLLVAPSRRQPSEPTLSLGAAAIVILAHQATDAARFLIFAIAVASAAPIPAGIGGAAGAGAVLTAGWLTPHLFAHPRLRTIRAGIGAALIVAGALTCLNALG